MRPLGSGPEPAQNNGAPEENDNPDPPLGPPGVIRGPKNKTQTLLKHNCGRFDKFHLFVVKGFKSGPGISKRCQSFHRTSDRAHHYESSHLCRVMVGRSEDFSSFRNITPLTQILSTRNQSLHIVQNRVRIVSEQKSNRFIQNTSAHLQQSPANQKLRLGRSMGPCNKYWF